MQVQPLQTIGTSKRVRVSGMGVMSLALQNPTLRIWSHHHIHLELQENLPYVYKQPSNLKFLVNMCGLVLDSRGISFYKIPVSGDIIVMSQIHFFFVMRAAPVSFYFLTFLGGIFFINS
jgi:hypothetical protein